MLKSVLQVEEQPASTVRSEIPRGGAHSQIYGTAMQIYAAVLLIDNKNCNYCEDSECATNAFSLF